jgi:cytochrome c
MTEYPIELVLDDAMRWVKEAIAFYRATGKAIALSEFSNNRGRFVQGEKYIYVLDMNGVMLAHGVNEKYLGKDFYRVQDSEGKWFIKGIVDIANIREYGWAEYKWIDPITRTEQPKTVYFERVDNMIFCSGVYGANLIFTRSDYDPLAEIVGDEVVLAHITPSGKPMSAGMPTEVSEEELSGLNLDDARDWVKKAIAFYRANGKEIALSECSSRLGRFARDELYVYVMNIHGTMLAHPVNEKYVGKDFYGIQDADGKGFIKEIVDSAKEGDCGWVEYKWFNPSTKRVQPKTVYFERVDGMIFCSGVYYLS